MYLHSALASQGNELLLQYVLIEFTSVLKLPIQIFQLPPFTLSEMQQELTVIF